MGFRDHPPSISWFLSTPAEIGLMISECDYDLLIPE